MNGVQLISNTTQQPSYLLRDRIPPCPQQRVSQNANSRPESSSSKLRRRYSGSVPRSGPTDAGIRTRSHGFEDEAHGFGICGLPFDAGHVPSVRVFHEADFAPYTTVWRRTPGGRRSICVDGPRHDTACPGTTEMQPTFPRSRHAWRVAPSVPTRTGRSYRVPSRSTWSRRRPR